MMATNWQKTGAQQHGKVLVVEDNTTVAMDLSGCLVDLGYEVTSIEVSGEEAVELVHDRYDIPVVFLSAYSDRALLEKAKRVGAIGPDAEESRTANDGRQHCPQLQ